MLVSELEKKAETKIRIASAPKSRPSDVSFKSGLRLYECGVEMVEKNHISSRTAKNVLKILWERNGENDPRVIVEENGWLQSSDENFIRDLCVSVAFHEDNSQKLHARTLTSKTVP